MRKDALPPWKSRDTGGMITCEESPILSLLYGCAGLYGSRGLNVSSVSGESFMLGKGVEQCVLIELLFERELLVM